MEVMVKYKKISILGAGPAGSTAAYNLAKHGIEVEIIDKVEFPRDKPCAGGLFNPLEYYHEFPYLKNVFIEGKDIYCVRFSCGKYSAEYTSEIPLLRTLLRKDFDYFLLKKALQAGAEFFVDKKPDGEIKIIATGAKSVNNYASCGICMVNDFPLQQDLDKTYIHYGFGGVKGYAWLFPKKGYVNIGIGAYLPQKNISSIYQAYIKYLENMGLICIEGKKGKAAIIPFSPLKKLYTVDSLIVGDAAGFVNTSTGEGIFFAMLSGKIAAYTIAQQKDFLFYQKECCRTFGNYLKTSLLVKRTNLLHKVIEKAVKIASKDKLFMKMMAENFFRLGNHRMGWRFLKNINL